MDFQNWEQGAILGQGEVAYLEEVVGVYAVALCTEIWFGKHIEIRTGSPDAAETVGTAILRHVVNCIVIHSEHHTAG